MSIPPANPLSLSISPLSVIGNSVRTSDWSRVRLFIDELGLSFFRVIEEEFSESNGFGKGEAQTTKDAVSRLRELGKEFITQESSQKKQKVIAQKLKTFVKKYYSIDQNISGLSTKGQEAIIKSFQLFLYVVEEAQNAERHLRCMQRLSSKKPHERILEWADASILQPILEKVSISLVFTKHPTTIKYREMRHALKEVFNHFARKDWELFFPDKQSRDFSPALSEESKILFRDSLDKKIKVLWGLPPFRPERPTVRGEMQDTYEQIKNEIIPSMVLVRRAIKEKGITLFKKSIHTIKQWVGFDTDGNPYVNSHSAAEALYLNSIKFLSDMCTECHDLGEPTLNDFFDALKNTLLERATLFNKLLLDSGLKESFFYNDELDSLLSHTHTALNTFKSSQELQDALSKVTMLDLDDVTRSFVETLEITGLSLSSGQFRENSKILETIVCSVIPDFIPNKNIRKNKSERALDIAHNEELLRDFFSNPQALSIIKDTLTHGTSSEEKKALHTVHMIEFLALAQKQLGTEILHEFILSLTENKSQVLGYTLLLQACKVLPSSKVIPLFEEFESLLNIDEILEELLLDEKISSALKGGDENITIFLGMSDGQKTTGAFFPYLVADAEERAIRTAMRHGEDITIFLGIGSSQARGQDRNPHREYETRPVHHSPRIERTIQGEAITRLAPGGIIGFQNLSKMLDALVSNHHLQATQQAMNSDSDSRVREAILTMNTSCQKLWSTLTLSDAFGTWLPGFAPDLDTLNVASRPSNRSAHESNSLTMNYEDTRAVPAEYLVIQSQSLLSSFYGAYEALEEFNQNPDFNDLKGDSKSTLYALFHKHKDVRFRKTIQFMLEGIASSDLDATDVMLELRLEALEDPELSETLMNLNKQIRESRDALVSLCETFVPESLPDEASSSIRQRVFAMLNNPLLVEDISRRLPYITIAGSIRAFCLAQMRRFKNSAPEFAEQCFDNSKIAACATANGAGQVG